MIQDQLKISLPLYDDILKQNRYRNECAAICDFKLLQPINKVPQFQVRFNKGETDGVDHWYIRCCDDDSIIFDLFDNLGLIQFENTLTDFEFYTYAGNDLVDFTLPCGCYYVDLGIREVADEPPEPILNYYSEVFTTLDEITDLSFVQSEFHLPTLWRWYNNIEKQNRNKNHCASICDFYLLSGNDSLLPFQFRFSTLLPISYTVTWSLVSIENDCETFLDDSLITISYAAGFNYVTYLGDNIDLPCGKFYSKVVIDGTPYYSELIEIIDEADNNETFYLLQENGFKILLENLFGLEIEH